MSTTREAPVPMSAVNASKENVTSYANEAADGKVDESEVVSHDAQKGVQKIEAITLSWTKASLACLLIK